MTEVRGLIQRSAFSPESYQLIAFLNPLAASLRIWGALDPYDPNAAHWM
jgi:hypothetical protein